EAADETGLEREVDLLTARYGDVPDWFGMAPYPYQRIGALCVAAGRRLLADAPGLGKSLQATWPPPCSGDAAGSSPAHPWSNRTGIMSSTGATCPNSWAGPSR